MKIEFDENKTYADKQLNEIKEQIDILSDIIYEHKNKIMLANEMDYTGKFIKYYDEYMYVTKQYIDQGRKRVIIEGLSVRGGIGNPYRDSNWFNFDAWRILDNDIEHFIRDVHDNGLIEITKEQFIDKVKNCADTMTDVISKWLKSLEENESLR